MDDILNQAASNSVKTAVEKMIDSLGLTGEDGLDKTPERVLGMYNELLYGYALNPEEIIKSALFNVKYDEMVVVENIDFYSLCEHHLMPFSGVAHVGYLPKDKIVGLSKIPRVVHAFSRRLQVQERLTNQIASAISKGVDALGVGVVMRATHMCTSIRGVKSPNTVMTTSAMRGAFKASAKTREEFMSLVAAAKAD